MLADCRDAIKSSWILFDKASDQKNAHWNSEILTGVMRETLRKEAKRSGAYGETKRRKITGRVYYPCTETRVNYESFVYHVRPTVTCKLT